MKKNLLLLLIFILLYSCGPEKEELTSADYEKEKQEIIKVIEQYTKAVEEENFSDLIETLATEVIFFGTDSGEVIKTFPDFKIKMEQQWKTFDKMDYGNMYDISIQMDDKATWASIIYGSPLTITLKDNTVKLFVRVARTLKKEKDRWVIVSGIVGNVLPEQALELQKLLQSKNENTEGNDNQ